MFSDVQKSITEQKVEKEGRKIMKKKNGAAWESADDACGSDRRVAGAQSFTLPHVKAERKSTDRKSVQRRYRAN